MNGQKILSKLFSLECEYEIRDGVIIFYIGDHEVRFVNSCVTTYSKLSYREVIMKEWEILDIVITKKTVVFKFSIDTPTVVDKVYAIVLRRNKL